MLTAPERPPATAWAGRAAREERPAGPRTPVAGMVVVVLAVALGTWATWSTTIDDAYITFRYALHWANGLGPTWNPGADPVEGFTNFAWTAWNAAFLALGADPAVVSKLTSAACAVATGWLLLRETRTPAGRITAVGAYLLFLPTWLHVVAGLETAAFALVVLRAVIVGRRVLDGRVVHAWELPALLLLAGMLRPEGALAALPALACLLLVRRTDGGRPTAVWLWTAAAAGLGAVYFGWRWWYFGHSLPNTFYVKFGNLDAGRAWIEATGAALAPLLVLLVAFAVASVRRPPVVRGGLLALSTVVLLWLPYALSGPSMDYLHRFAFHALPVLCLAAGLVLDTARSARGAAIDTARSARGAGIDTAGPRRVTTAVAAVVVGWTAVAGITAADAPVILNYGTDLERTHAAIGRGLAEAGVPAPERTLAVSDAGAIPYFSRWDAIDYIGLNDEAIAHGASPTRVVGDARPTVVVVTGGAGGPPDRAYGMDVPAVTSGYQQVAAVWLREDYWQYVFVRPEWAAPVGAAVRAEVGRAQSGSDGRWDETFDRWADRTLGPDALPALSSG